MMAPRVEQAPREGNDDVVGEVFQDLAADDQVRRRGGSHVIQSE